MFKKKIFGEDKHGILSFHVKKMNANTLDKLKKLCENNPNKCADIRPELCKKMFVLSNYPKIPDDACRMYINIVESIKTYVHPKKNCKIKYKTL